MVFVDVLRVAVIVMVIAHHAAQAYGPTGATWPVTDPHPSDWFRPFYTVNAAVGMGLLAVEMRLLERRRAHEAPLQQVLQRVTATNGCPPSEVCGDESRYVVYDLS
jgi:hypothetical protein